MMRRHDDAGHVHPCRWSRTLYVVGPLILLGFLWLAHTIYASDMERAVMKTQLENMSSDISEIKELIKKAINKP